SIFNLLLISILPIIKVPLTILGVGYILYFTSKGINNNEKNDETNKNLFLIGVLIQFINPKGILYGITVVSTFILPYYTSYFSYFIFSLFLGIIGFLSSLCWSIFGSIFQKSLSKYQKPFNIIMALLLIYSAISIVLH
ncbi:LysE family transporter, partial [Niallia circulans]|uniref:LysE family transporter n=1 Tax=Niallia circulans TaxID=1397 RepID=UPI0015605F74